MLSSQRLRLSAGIGYNFALDAAKPQPSDVQHGERSSQMLTSLRSARKATVGAAGVGMLAGAMLFGGTPVAQAAPTPAPGTTFEVAGPHGAPDLPLRPGGGG